MWIDDPHFDLDHHLRRSALPAPGDEKQLRHLATRLLSQPLDPTKPLWELWIVEALADGTWAQVNKAHHGLVAGLAAIDMTTFILDREPESSEPPPDKWQPNPEPSRLRLIADAVASQVTSSSGSLRRTAAALTHPRQAATRIGTTARGTASLAGVGRPGSATTLTGPIGPNRRWDCSRSSITDVKTVRRAFGGTANDVVLALVTRGFRDLLLARGAPLEGIRLRAVVPVSLRRPGQPEYSNRVGSMYAELPVSATEPVRRLQAISAQLVHLKDSGQAAAGDDLLSLSGLLPPSLLAPALRIATKIPQHSIATVITNLPGPPVPLYALGRRMLSMYPYVPIGWRYGSVWRSSPTSACSTSDSPAITTPPQTSTCCVEASKPSSSICSGLPTIQERRRDAAHVPRDLSGHAGSAVHAWGRAVRGGGRAR